MSVVWDRHFRQLYAQHLPERVDDVPAMLTAFAGQLESLWLATCRRFGADPRLVVVQPLQAPRVANTVRQRIARLYARYAPANLRDLDSTMDLVHQEGAAMVLRLLSDKYGPEPLPEEPLAIRERIAVLYATYGRHKDIDELDATLAMYRGMEDALLSRLIGELGPEPHAQATSDLRDPRQRLRRILLVHDPSMLSQVEVILARFAGRQVFLFATMQRRYGPEPSPLDVQVLLEEKASRTAARQAQADTSRASAALAASPAAAAAAAAEAGAVAAAAASRSFGTDGGVGGGGGESGLVSPDGRDRWPSDFARSPVAAADAAAAAARAASLAPTSVSPAAILAAAAAAAAHSANIGLQRSPFASRLTSGEESPAVAGTPRGPGLSPLPSGGGVGSANTGAAGFPTPSPATAGLARRQDTVLQIQTFARDPVLDVVPFEHPLPGGAERDTSVLQLRAHLQFQDKLPAPRLLELTTELFRTHERTLVPCAVDFVRARYGRLDETLEALSYLDTCFANAVPATRVPQLRTIASLLELKKGSAFQEAWEAGGVDRFLARIDPHSHADWAVFLLVRHGKVTEQELATRNRLRAHYLHYNPDVSPAEADQAVLKTFAGHSGSLHAALTKHYGPEPPPLRVDVPRVVRVLTRNAPERVADAAVVIEAHTDAGDTADRVLAKIIRTYGGEPSEDDAKITQLLGAEFEARFALHATQLRFYGVILRRCDAVVSGEGTEHSVAMAVARAMADSARTKPSAPLAAAAAAAAASAAASAAAAAAAAASGIDNAPLVAIADSDDPAAAAAAAALVLARAERRQRQAISEAERRAFLSLLATDAGVAIDVWDEDGNVALSEALRRHALTDEAIAAYPAMREAMLREESALRVWLDDRLRWREKWAADAAVRAAVRAKAEMTPPNAANALSSPNSGAGGASDPQVFVDPFRDSPDAAAARARSTRAARAEAVRLADLEEELAAQTRRVVQMEAAVAAARRADGAARRLVSEVTLTRPPAEGSAFRRAEYTVLYPIAGAASPAGLPSAPASASPRGPASPGRDAAAIAGTAGAPLGVASVDASTHRLFGAAVTEYVASLLRRHDARHASPDEVARIVRDHEGREGQLIEALEQQCGTSGSIRGRSGNTLRVKVLEYLRAVAPGKEEEADVLLAKFAFREELVWPFLTARYGQVPPGLQTGGLRSYLKGRLVRYLSMRAPHLLAEVDACIAQCADNGDGIFRRLVAEFGPEDPDEERDALERKLRAFYRRRGLQRGIDNVPLIAARFVGREPLLNELLSAKFGDTLIGEMPDVL